MKHVMSLATLASLACSAISLPAQAGPQPAREGLWEYTTQMEMPGMPAHPMTTRVCLSAKDMEEGPMPKDDNCKLKDYKLSGNTANWKMECKGEESMTGEGKISFQGDSAYNGETRMRIQMKGEAPMETRQKFSARRLGDCKK